MTIPTVLVAAAALAAAAHLNPAAGQNSDLPFAQLEGTWDGSGSLFGRDAGFAMEWRRHGDMVLLTFENALTPSDGPRAPMMSASAIYRTTPATPEAVWLDSRGARLEIRWQATDTSLVALWTNDVESGRTTYTLRGGDVVQVTDEVMDDGVWQTFGRATYRRRSR